MKNSPSSSQAAVKKILLTGATGYIGKRLLQKLLEEDCMVYCCVRDRQRFDTTPYESGRIEVIEADFLKPETLDSIPGDLDAAYYLIHSMTSSKDSFEELERESALNFRAALEKTSVEQVIYLSGIVNDEHLSTHLRSRKAVEEILSDSSFHLTTLRAGIIVGSGSASFEIIRDLVEKLPVMIAPKWLNTRTQPIAIRNVIQFLSGVLLKPFTYDQNYDIGGPKVMTYREMLKTFSRVRGLNRIIMTVPVLTPKLSSYWLYFITSTSYNLASSLVGSMMVDVVCKPNDLHEKLGIDLIPYSEAIELAFGKIEQQGVLSSWLDATSSNKLDKGVAQLIEVPGYGCFTDRRTASMRDARETLEKIWAIGGDTGWYYADWLWKLRGFLDKLVGGVGLRRGRRSSEIISAGDALDFWRVLHADKENGRLLLYAEMNLPGEAWLEFKIEKDTLIQTATFRPLGVAGRLYWYSVLPFHGFIFQGMLDKLVE
ncbi:MAG: SDR family oxidoreductase [Gracilimonas sp.]|uniref:SDR family oxidoreductase n=1 Tax=Gracilimonas sp. TaxID=1974203 RepID=UPI00199186DB|nr:SDR family oxidoreductase [Gracilimonas sp.]MBD3617733.1 SDR family oxidoreductase [Gracilimonas sp.]